MGGIAKKGEDQFLAGFLCHHKLHTAYMRDVSAFMYANKFQHLAQYYLVQKGGLKCSVHLHNEIALSKA